MKKLFLGLTAAAVLAGGPASAHHSFAMFDNNKLVVLRGTLLSFTYLNPHSWISIIGNADHVKTSPRRWDIEATAPITLRMMGLKADSMKPGDKLVVGIRPLRDGRDGGSMVFVVTADGVSHGAKAVELGLDAATLKPR